MSDMKAFAQMIGRQIKAAIAPSIERLAAIELRVSNVKDGAPGPQGEKGIAGDRGEKGESGINGDKGEVGERGEKGEAGQPGPKGEKGEVGAPGDRGEKGEAGEKGAAGIGERGEPGPAGQVGERGAAGIDGKDGASGARGDKGEKGIDGRNGVDGLAIRPEISIDSTRTYREGIWASYKGGLVRAMRDTDPLADGSLEQAGWEVMVDGIAEIEVAQNGVRKFAMRVVRTSGELAEQDFSMPVMIYRDVYRQGEDYDKGDVTTWAGSTWHAEVDHPKSAPGTAGSTEWKLIVKRGRDGKDGKDK